MSTENYKNVIIGSGEGGSGEPDHRGRAQSLTVRQVATMLPGYSFSERISQLTPLTLGSRLRRLTICSRRESWRPVLVSTD